MSNQQAPSLVRLPTILAETQLSKSTIYRMVQSGTFPAPVRLSHKCVGWRREDIETWQANLSATIH